MTPITYMSDQPGDYVKALDEATTLPKLRAVAEAWSKLASDAAAIILKMTEEDFKVWRAGLALERRGEFAGEDFAMKYGAVQMPEVLFKVSMIADRFGAPWGLTYMRLKETGELEKALA